MQLLKDRQHKSAFDDLFDKYYQALCFFSSSFVKDSEVAKDIVHDSFVHFWNNIEEVDSRMEKRVGYLYQSVRNRSLNYIRDNKIQNKVRDNIKNTTDSWEKEHLYALMQSEVYGMLNNALDQLPKQCRKVMKMAYIMGLKEKEISDKLGITLSSVKSHKQRGKALLKERLKHLLCLMLIVNSLNL